MLLCIEWQQCIWCCSNTEEDKHQGAPIQIKALAIAINNVQVRSDLFVVQLFLVTFWVTVESFAEECVSRRNLDEEKGDV